MIILDIGPSERTYTIVLNSPHFAPSTVEINKETLEKARDLTNLESKSVGWCLNDKDLIVKFHTNGKSCLITIHK